MDIALVRDGVLSVTASLSPVDVSSQSLIEFVVRLAPHDNDAHSSELAAGTVLTVHIPSGWHSLENVSAAHWTPTGPTGSTVLGWVQTFTLNADLAAMDQVRIRAKPPVAPTSPFGIMQIDLAHGSLGHSEVVLKYPGLPEDGLPRTLHTTMPYPLLPGADALFGVAVANGGAVAHVTQLDVTIAEGYDLTRLSGDAPKLFAGVPTAVGSTDADGAWSLVSPTHLRWTALEDGEGRQILPNDVSEWLIRVPITDDPKQATAVEPPTSGGVESVLRFSNGFMHRSTSWGRAPGVIRHLVPPEIVPGAGDGYPHAALAAGTSQTYSYDVWVRRTGVNLTTTGTYVALPDGGDVSSVQNALGNARIDIGSRKVPVGTVLVVDQDFRSLAQAIAAEGVGGFTITNDLYAPPTLGCDPVRSWTRTSETLPLPAIVDLASFDLAGGNDPDLFVIGQDAGAYRVSNTAGVWSTVWSRDFDVGSPLTDLVVGNAGPSGNAVFVGDEKQRIWRVDTSGLGLGEWSEVVQGSEGAVETDPTAVVGMALDPATGRLLARVGKVLELRDAATGALVARRDLGEGGFFTTDRWLNAEWGPNGDVYAQSTHRLYRLDATTPDLRTRGTEADEDPIGVAVTPAGALVVLHDKIVRYPLDLEGDGSQVGPTDAFVLGTSGDANGDGVRDLVALTAGMHAFVIDGATGSVYADRPVAFEDIGQTGLAVPVPSTLPPMSWGPHGIESEPVMGPVYVNCEEAGANYETAVPCTDLADPRNAQPASPMLAVGEGWVLVSYHVGEVARLSAWRPQTGAFHQWVLPAGELTSATALGAWPAGAPAFLAGTNAGRAVVYTQQDEINAVATIEPAADVGHFQTLVPVPAGGFFGTHALVTRVGWTDPVRGAMEVTLPDWFNVVGADGVPVLAPAYRLHLAVRDPSAHLP